MRKMKKYVVMFCALLAMGASVASCSSDEEVVQGAAGQGEAMVMFDVATNVAYSRTIYDDAKVAANYKLTLTKEGESEPLFKDVAYSDLELEYKVEADVNYTLSAYYGEDVPAGFDKLYMTGSATFNVAAGDKKTVTISTNPANSKLILAYKGLKEDGSDKFTDYFKDCAVSIKTSYMTEAFSMAIADEGKELFLKTSNDDNEGDGTAVDLAFTITNKEGEVVTVEGFEANKTVYIKPAYAYTVTITPAKNGVDGGLVGLNITVDNGVTDEDVNITIPAEYLSTTATE